MYINLSCTFDALPLMSRIQNYYTTPMPIHHFLSLERHLKCRYFWKPFLLHMSSSCHALNQDPSTMARNPHSSLPPTSTTAPRRYSQPPRCQNIQPRP